MNKYMRLDWTLSSFVVDKWKEDLGDPVIRIDLTDPNDIQYTSLGREDIPVWLSDTLIPPEVEENMYLFDTNIVYVRLRYTENNVVAKYWALRGYNTYICKYHVTTHNFGLYELHPCYDDHIEVDYHIENGQMSPDCHIELTF